MAKTIEEMADDCYYHNHAYARESYIEGANAVLGCSEFTINVYEFRKYMEGE